jgi:hypothetical protein
VEILGRGGRIYRGGRRMSDELLSMFIAFACILAAMVIIFVLTGGVEILEELTKK